jgi:hypothetical protein
MTDWAAWGTSVGTLVLAGATFAAVRSGNRSARVAERALLVGMRPTLAPPRHDDPVQQVQFADGRVFDLQSGGAMVRADGGVIYLALPLRNTGVGVAVLSGYHLEGDSAERTFQDPLGPARHRRGDAAPEASLFSEQQRDLFVAAGSLGFWQAALRDASDARYQAVEEAIRTAGRITVDLLYTDQDGGQPTVTRFVLLPSDGAGWRCEIARHWSLAPAR